MSVAFFDLTFCLLFYIVLFLKILLELVPGCY